LVNHGGIFVSLSKYSLSDKLKIIEGFRESNLTKTAYATSVGISKNTFKRWLMLYERDGIDGLKDRNRYTQYSLKLKLQVVGEYLDGNTTMDELVLKYGLRTNSVVVDWVFKYTDGKSLNKVKPAKKRGPNMSRKTTFEDRIEVVEYIVKDHHSYNDAAERFLVSYQQARSWVKKAKKGGNEALQDGRGHRRKKEDFTDLDEANLKIKQLESQLRNQKIIEEFSKKFQELQRKG